MLAQMLARWLMRPVAIAAALCMGVSVAYAVEIPTAGEALTLSQQASRLEASGVWALFAGTLFLSLMLLGWGVWSMGVKVLAKLASMSEDIAALKAHAERGGHRK